MSSETIYSWLFSIEKFIRGDSFLKDKPISEVHPGMWVVGYSTRVVSGSSLCVGPHFGKLSIENGKFLIKNACFPRAGIMTNLTLTDKSRVHDFIFKSNAILSADVIEPV